MFQQQTRKQWGIILAPLAVIIGIFLANNLWRDFSLYLILLIIILPLYFITQAIVGAKYRVNILYLAVSIGVSFLISTLIFDIHPTIVQWYFPIYGMIFAVALFGAYGVIWLNRKVRTLIQD